MLVKFFDRGHVKKHHSLGGDGAKNYLLTEVTQPFKKALS